MKTLNEMRALAKAGKLNYLTLSDAIKLRGKRIETIYFGYAGQDGIDNFVVGNVVSEYDYYKFYAKEDGFPNEEGYQNRAEYWEFYLPAAQLVRLKNRLILLRKDGSQTNLFVGIDGETFCCSDEDRFVSFLELSDHDQKPI